MTLEFSGPATKLTETNYQTAADFLDCDLPAIKAVTEVEARGAGYLPDKRPQILFERHKFSKFTNRAHDGSHPNISSRRAGGYGRGGKHQYERLHQAIPLNREAALKSASWGMFQIMGFNHGAAGFNDVESFVAKMCESEGAHLKAFVHFVLANPSMANALRSHRWADFARRYNGSGYRQNRYDEKLAAAYARNASDPGSAPEMSDHRVLDEGDRGEDVRALQMQLNELGADPALTADGIFGSGTDAAIRKFQEKANLTVDGKVGPATWLALTGDDDDDTEEVSSTAPTANLAGSYNHYTAVDQEAWQERWPNFSPQEIACKGTGKLLVNEKALDCLQDLREKLGTPLILNSAYRSPEHNRRVGGASRSKHMEGIAFDVSMHNQARNKFEDTAREVGFKGIGFYPGSNFIHIDTRPNRTEWGTRW